MKKHLKFLIVMIVGMVSLSSLSAAADIWIQRFATTSMINIASKQFWKPTNTWATGAPPLTSNGFYYDAQMLSVIGVKGSSTWTTVTFQSDWYLRSASDPSIRRPYSVCLIPRTALFSNTGTHQNYPTPGVSNFPVYGFLGKAIQSDVATFYLPPTNGTRMADGRQFSSSWIDVVFVLDPVVNTSDNSILNMPKDLYNLTTCDDFIGQVTVTVTSENKVETATFYFNGYYYPDATTEAPIYTSQMVVTPRVGADYLNIIDLYNNGNPRTIPIADVHFTTVSSRNTAPTVSYYLFLSSSRFIDATGDRFEFRRRGSTGASTQYNSIKFKVIVPQPVMGTYPTGGTTITYDGTDSYASIMNNNSKLMKAVTTKSFSQDATIYNSDYKGSMNLKLDTLTATESIDDLMEGLYDTNIYVHVFQK